MKNKLTITITALSLALSLNAKKSHTVDIDEYVVTATPHEHGVSQLTQPWSVIGGSELDVKRNETIGETLAWEPGISSSFFAPGASRPVIRGQEGQRVGILSNGTGSLDLSKTSGDHAIAVDPLLVEQIEVLRGPATLLYGGGTIGGLVNVVDGRIASEMPDAIEGAVAAEYTSVNEGRYTGFKVNVPTASGIVVHVDGVFRETEDYDTPNFSPEEGEDAVGVVKNSDTQVKSGAFGASYINDRGHIGFSLSRYESVYGVLTEEEKAPFIDLEQTRFDLQGEQELDMGVLESVSAHFGYSDYAHNEFVNPTTLGAGFELDAYETRFEVNHTLLSEGGVLGFQINNDDLRTPSAESIFSGNSINKVESNTYSLFLLEEVSLGEASSFHFGGRVDSVEHEVSGTAPALGDRDFTAYSGSAGIVGELTENYDLGLNFAYVERAPAAEELYANGLHEAIESFNIQSESLDKERSFGLDLSIRKARGDARAEFSVFGNYFDNYIFSSATGREVSEEGESPVPAGEEALTERQYKGVRALFAGFEFSLDSPVWKSGEHEFALSFMSDYTFARNMSKDSDLPRIPPLRVGGGLEYNNDDITIGTEVRHAFEQEDFDTGESKTESYTLWNLYGSYDLPVQDHDVELFLRGNNLTDELAYSSTSLRKEKSPLQGRSLNVGVKYLF